MAAKKSRRTNQRAALAPVVALAGWFVPGLGHLLLRRWSRAAVFFAAVAALAGTGILMRGNIFSPQGADVFDMLGFFADIGAGLFYFVSRLMAAAPDVSRAAGDYGTRLFATAGVLNLLCVLDAYQIARGKKS